MSLWVNIYNLSIYTPSLCLQLLSNLSPKYYSLSSLTHTPSPLEGGMRTRTLQDNYLICLWQCPQKYLLRNSPVLYVPEVFFVPCFWAIWRWAKDMQRFSCKVGQQCGLLSEEELLGAANTPICNKRCPCQWLNHTALYTGSKDKPDKLAQKKNKKEKWKYS